jgi:thymidylate synthase (FAD)
MPYVLLRMQEKEVNAPYGINATKRSVSEGGEDLLFKELDVANHGSVTLIDYLGSDDVIERVATAGHGRRIFPEESSQRDFLSHIAEIGIRRPFSFGQMKFLVEGPIQMAEHDPVYEKDGSKNEYSGRYSVMIDSAYVPSPEELVDLGWAQNLEQATQINGILTSVRQRSKDDYQEMLKQGLTRELARGVLGSNNDTKFIWKIGLGSLVSQVDREEFREDAMGVGVQSPYYDRFAEIAASVFPNSWNALREPSVKSRLWQGLSMPTDDVVVDGSLNLAEWEPSSTKRIVVEPMEALLFENIPYLHNGEFQVFDYMGDDDALAEAARTSYGRGTTKAQGNKGLIRSLIRDAHTSPIEMAQISWMIKGPEFSDPRQAGRHRTLSFAGFMDQIAKGDTAYIPDMEELQKQDLKNRQGRAGALSDGARDFVSKTYHENVAEQVRAVNELRAHNAPEELIRGMKGVCFNTRISRTGDLHNIAHYLRLRDHGHAQHEIREAAKLVGQAYKSLAPVAHQAQLDYNIEGERFSRMEMEMLSGMIEKGMPQYGDNIYELDLMRYAPEGEPGGRWYKRDKETGVLTKERTREGDNFIDKIGRLLGYDVMSKRV